MTIVIIFSGLWIGGQLLAFLVIVKEGFRFGLFKSGVVFIIICLFKKRLIAEMYSGLKFSGLQ